MKTLAIGWTIFAVMAALLLGGLVFAYNPIAGSTLIVSAGLLVWMVVLILSKKDKEASDLERLALYERLKKKHAPTTGSKNGN